MTAVLVLILGGREENCFCGRDWTGQISLISLRKLTFARNAIPDKIITPGIFAESHSNAC